MKKITLVAMALICSVAFTDCAAKKPVKQAEPAPVAQQESETQRKIRELKEQQELEDLQAEAELRALEREAKKRKLQTQMALTEQMADGHQKMVKFCYEESLDKPGEYMAGLGVSAPRKLERDAKIEARQMAVQDIAAGLVGMLKSGTEYYSQSGTTQGGKGLDESQLEGMTINLVEKAVDKYMNQVCYESVQDNDGKYIYYLAGHILEGTAVDEVADALDKAELIRDKNTFKKQLLKELENDKAVRDAEREQKLQLYRELQNME